jgi:chromosome condensin MukBEF ATPase and DNA-binding subunit MukB
MERKYLELLDADARRGVIEQSDNPERIERALHWWKTRLTLVQHEVWVEEFEEHGHRYWRVMTTLKCGRDERSELVNELSRRLDAQADKRRRAAARAEDRRDRQQQAVSFMGRLGRRMVTLLAVFAALAAFSLVDVYLQLPWERIFTAIIWIGGSVLVLRILFEIFSEER